MAFWGLVAGSVISGLLGGRSSPRPDPAVGQAQMQMAALAQSQENFFREEIYPHQRALLDRFTSQAEEVGDAQLRQMAQQAEMADFYGQRARTIQAPFEDMILEEARLAGGEFEQARAAGMALADVSQAVNRQRQAAIRTGRAYGADLNKLMAAQADAAPNEALAMAAAMNRARESARQLGFDKRMAAASLQRNLPAAQNMASQAAITAGSAAMQTGGAPLSQGNALAATMANGYAGAGSLYGQAGALGAGVFGTQMRGYGVDAGLDAQAMSGFGRYWAQNGPAAIQQVRGWFG